MSINSVSLTTGLNASLHALSKTGKSLNQNLQSLSTGQKPVIDPISFSASQSLMARVGDITASKDSITNSITTNNIAQTGFQGVNQLLKSAQGIASAAQGASPADQASLASDYQTMISQANQLANDSGIGSTVSSLLPPSTLSTTSQTELGSAIGSLRQQSASAATSLNSTTALQQFDNSMANIMQAGSEKLTLVDMNEQAAGVLMLQTQQQLGTASMSLSAKSAQSVLKLFSSSN